MQANPELMKRAISIATESAEKGDYSVGAIVSRGNDVIATGETMLNRINDPTLHAEIVAIRTACKVLGSRLLEGCVLYSTHEPCPMCTATAIWAKMKGIVFGATIEDARGKATKDFSWRQIDMKCRDVVAKGNPKIGLVEGFMRDDCIKLFDLL